jgi:acetyltransferase-like isoleucine patch superfamily enzyme
MRILRRLISIFFYFWRKWNFKYFGWNSRIITPTVCIKGKRYIIIGKHTTICKHARIEAVYQYGKCNFIPQLVIGSNVLINQNFHCTCANYIKIGDGTSITANCGIFDIIHPYENINKNPRETSIETKKVVIGQNCLIGMNSVILPGTFLGNHCIVGANSTVSGFYPDYCVLAGSPAKIIKKFNFDSNKWEKYATNQENI